MNPEAIKQGLEVLRYRETLYDGETLKRIIEGLLEGRSACPKCGAPGMVVGSKRKSAYRRFECPYEHRWTTGALPRGRPRKVA